MTVVLRVGPGGPVYNRPPKLRPGTRVVVATKMPDKPAVEIAAPAAAASAPPPVKAAPVIAAETDEK